MKKQQLLLYKTQSGTYRSVFKTKHGRLIYLEVSVDDNNVHIKDCYYIDRKRAGEYYARPKKLISRDFSFNEILDVVSSQLDRKFYGVDIRDKFTDLVETEFINTQIAAMQTILFFGEGFRMKEYKFDMPDSKKCGLILEDADALVRIGSYRNHGMIAKDIGLGIVLHQDNRGEMKRNIPERWLNSVKFI